MSNDKTAHPFRYKKIGYVTLGVTDIPRSVAYYRDMMGLDVSEDSASDIAFLNCSDEHHDLVLRKSEEPLLISIGFELESEADVRRAFDHVAQLGLEPRFLEEKGAAGFQGLTFAFHLPFAGVRLEFFSGMVTAKQPFSHRLTRIMRLGHAVIGLPDPIATGQYLVDNLGFRISDQVDGVIVFLRAHPNPLHHSLALTKAPAPVLNHVNFMVEGIDDIGRAFNRLKRADVPIVYGPGRHPPSDSIFLYFLDPDGMTMEFSFGMEEFPEEFPRAFRTIARSPEAVDSWGAVRDPRMGTVGQISQNGNW